MEWQSKNTWLELEQTLLESKLTMYELLEKTYNNCRLQAKTWFIACTCFLVLIIVACIFTAIYILSKQIPFAIISFAIPIIFVSLFRLSLSRFNHTNGKLDSYAKELFIVKQDVQSLMIAIRIKNMEEMFNQNSSTQPQSPYRQQIAEEPYILNG